MNITDIVLAVPIIMGAFYGFRKGFVLEIVSILSLILGIIGGFHLLHWGISFLEEQFNIEGGYLPFLSFILIFLAIIILVNLLGKAVKGIIDLTPLGSVDNLVGGLLGALKWAFAFSVLIWLLTTFSIGIPEHLIVDSFLYPFVSMLAPKIIEYVSVLIPVTTDIFNTIAGEE